MEFISQLFGALSVIWAFFTLVVVLIGLTILAKFFGIITIVCLIIGAIANIANMI